MQKCGCTEAMILCNRLKEETIKDLIASFQPGESFLPPGAQNAFCAVCDLCDLQVRQSSSENLLVTGKWGGGRMTALGFYGLIQEFWFLYLSKRRKKQEKSKGFWYFVKDLCFSCLRILVCNFSYCSDLFHLFLLCALPLFLLVLDSLCPFSLVP